MGLATASGGGSPRRLRGGGFRARWARILLAWRCAPAATTTLVVPVTTLAAWRAAWPLGIDVAVAFLAFAWWQRGGLGRIYSRAYWSLTWFADVRAGGLARLAERDLDRLHDPGDSTVEVAPALLKLRIQPGRRSYIVRPAPGQTLADFERATDALRLRWRAVTVTATLGTGSRLARGRVTIDVTTRDPLAAPSVRVRTTAAVPVAVGLGRYEDGSEFKIDLGLHLLVGGLSGMGKSIFLRRLLAALASNPNVQLVGIDLKRVELSAFAPRLNRLARTPVEAADLVADLAATVDSRFARLETDGRDQWTTDDGPYLALVVDELGDLLARGNARIQQDLRRIVTLGRAAGVIAILATQRPSHDVVPTSIRDNIGRRIAFATANRESTVMVLGELADSAPAHLLDRSTDGRGVCWVVVDGEEPRRARISYLDREDAERIAGQTAHFAANSRRSSEASKPRPVAHLPLVPGSARNSTEGNRAGEGGSSPRGNESRTTVERVAELQPWDPRVAAIASYVLPLLPLRDHQEVAATAEANGISVEQLVAMLAVCERAGLLERDSVRRTSALGVPVEVEPFVSVLDAEVEVPSDEQLAALLDQWMAEAADVDHHAEVDKLSPSPSDDDLIAMSSDERAVFAALLVRPSTTREVYAAVKATGSTFSTRRAERAIESLAARGHIRRVGSRYTPA